MVLKKDYPILEFYNDKNALINPIYIQEKYAKLSSDKLVITFLRGCQAVIRGR